MQITELQELARIAAINEAAQNDRGIDEESFHETILRMNEYQAAVIDAAPHLIAVAAAAAALYAAANARDEAMTEYRAHEWTEQAETFREKARRCGDVCREADVALREAVAEMEKA